MTSDLASQIAARTETVRRRIAEAADRAGRDPDAVTLIGVTKKHPLDVVRAAIACGVRDLGENRVGEFEGKSDEVPGEALGGDVRWHFVGSLQRNKARDVAERADLFHALDSPRLARELDKRAGRAERVLPVLAQVNISREDAKHGVPFDEAHDFLERAAEHEHLRVVGLMGMAEIARSDDELETLVRPAFARLRELYETAPVPLSVLSMGMSGDYEVAVEEGATHVRLGTALFGPRG